MLGLACDNGLLCTLGSNNMNTASKSAPRNRDNDERLSCQKNLAKVPENGANSQRELKFPTQQYSSCSISSHENPNRSDDCQLEVHAIHGVAFVHPHPTDSGSLSKNFSIDMMPVNVTLKNIIWAKSFANNCNVVDILTDTASRTVATDFHPFSAQVVRNALCPVSVTYCPQKVILLTSKDLCLYSTSDPSTQRNGSQIFAHRVDIQSIEQYQGILYSFR